MMYKILHIPTALYVVDRVTPLSSLNFNTEKDAEDYLMYVKQFAPVADGVMIFSGEYSWCKTAYRYEFEIIEVDDV